MKVNYHNLYEILDNLFYCDGVINRLVISDRTVDLLCKLGYASKNIRGSYGYTQKYTDTLLQFDNNIDDLCDHIFSEINSGK